MSLQTNQNMIISVIRPGLVYRPDGNVFPRDVGIRLGRRIVLVFGLGSRRLPLVYVDNLIDALIVTGEKSKNEKNVLML